MSFSVNSSFSVNAASDRDLTMGDSTSPAPAPAPANQPTQSALMSFMKHGPQSLMDDDIKPREVPGRWSTSSRAAKARIDEPETRILSPALYPQEYTSKLKQLATLCVELDQVKQLLRDRVKRRQTGGCYKPRVRFAREVLPIDLNTVVRELKEERKAAAAAAANQGNDGADSAMDVDVQALMKDVAGKVKKRAASPMDSTMEVDTQALSKKARKRRNRKAKQRATLMDTEMKEVFGKRKRSADTEMEDDTSPPVSKKTKDALDLSDLARDLPTFCPAARLVPETTDKPLLDWYRTFSGA